MTKWDDDSADVQLLEQEHLQQFLEPRLNRAEQAYNQALKAVWLGNAGAAIAMLSFIGASWRGTTLPKPFIWPLGFFVLGLIAMGVGELITLIAESRAIRRIQYATTIVDINFRDVESPAEKVGLYMSPRTLLALTAGCCFVAGACIGFVAIYLAV